MYLGLHGLTQIELPDKQITFSRDIYLNLKPQKVIEIIGVGKYIVVDVTTQFSRDRAVESLISLAAPCYVVNLKVIFGNLAEIETDHQFRVGIELRPETEAEFPPFSALVRQANFILTALEQAEALNAAAKAVASGRLSASIRERVLAATVFIESEYKIGTQVSLGSGTGFVINPNGFIVTNGHVVRPARILSPEIPNLVATLSSVQATFNSGLDKQVTLPANVICYSEAPDLALLKVDETGLDFLCLDQEETTELEAVIALGYPGGKGLAFSGGTPGLSFRSGQITAIRSQPSERTITVEHSAPIEQGNSGGPLVTPCGTVVGVNTFVTGPQAQSRFAISKDTLWGFLFQEGAEGKGPYYGPTLEEKYVIAIAQINLVWDSLDNRLFDFQTHRPYSSNVSTVQETLSPHQAKTLGTEITQTFNNLLQTLPYTSPPPQYLMPHRRIIEATNAASEAIHKMLSMIDQDTNSSRATKPYPTSQNNLDRHMEIGALGNEVQAARTQFFLAINTVIGAFYRTTNQCDLPEPPLWLPLVVDKYDADKERQSINDFGGIFQRHRGKRVVIFHFTVEGWKRLVVYPYALVSGSSAMCAEMNRLVNERGWGELPQDHKW